MEEHCSEIRFANLINKHRGVGYKLLSGVKRDEGAAPNLAYIKPGIFSIWGTAMFGDYLALILRQAKIVGECSGHPLGMSDVIFVSQP